MSRRSVTLIALALLFAGLNVWRWWPDLTPTAKRSATDSAHGFQPQDFQIAGVTDTRETMAVRDLFWVKRLPPVAKQAPAPPPKSPEQIAQEAARAELAQVKLLAIAEHGGRAEAFVSNVGEPMIVRKGSQVGSRFVVDAITTEMIRLHDPQTDVSGTFYLAER